MGQSSSTHSSPKSSIQSSQFQQIDKKIRELSSYSESLRQANNSEEIAKWLECIERTAGELRTAVFETDIYRQIPLIYFQDENNAFPDLEYLKQKSLHFKRVTINELEKCSNCKLLFYVVHHTARFESVNLNSERLMNVKQMRNAKVVLLAFTPGNSNTSPPAPNQTQQGDPVITLWYQNGRFLDKENEKSYQMIQSYIKQLF